MERGILKSHHLKSMKFLNLLEDKERTKLIFIFLLMIISSGLEVLSIGVVIPLIQSLVNFDQNNIFVFNLTSYVSKYFSTNSIITITIIVLIVFIIRNLFLIFLTWFRSKFVVYLKARWQDKIFKLYLYQDYNFHLEKNSAILIRNIQQEVSQCINSYISPLLDFCLNLLILAVITLFLFYFYPLNTLFVIIFFGSFAIFINLILKKILFKIGQIRQKTNLKMLQYMQEGFGNIINVKMLNAENFFVNLFNPHNYKMAKYGVKRAIYGSMPKLIFELIFILLIVSSIIFVSLTENSLQELFSKLIIFSIAALRIIPALNSVSVNYQKIRFGKPALDLIYQETKNLKIIKKSYNKEAFEFDGDIEIKNISFKHNNADEKLFNDLSFKIKKNQVNGIVGPNGSGKTTLINIICGLISPDEGAIQINNKNIKENLFNWQNLIGFIPQNIYMIDDTIEANIALGVDKEKINRNKIVEIMNLTELKPKFEPDYEIGEHGNFLSGGQKQKIAISRALYKKPEILIFDEPTSALDSEAEKKFIDNFIKNTNKTVILISHKNEPLKYCDLIFELKDGKIIKKEI